MPHHPPTDPGARPSTTRLKTAYRDLHTIDNATGPRERRPDAPSFKAWARELTRDRRSPLQESASQWFARKSRGRA